MKLQIASDLHLDFNLSRRYPVKLSLGENSKEHILVLAGDICEIANINYAKDFFTEMCNNFKYVLYVAGNHEMYRGNTDTSMNTFHNVIGQYFDNLIHTTDGKIFKHDEIKFIMATTWTGWNLPKKYTNSTSLSAMKYAQRNMNDFFCIAYENGKIFTAEKSKELHEKQIKFIEDELSKKDYQKSVVITHHPISTKCIHQKYMGDELNAAFSSDYSKMLNVYKPDLVISGHTHSSFDFMENEKTRYLVNPHGYGKENISFNPQLTIEI